MVKRLGFVWSVWKLAAKRFGPVGGAVAALVALAGFGMLKRMLRDRYPEAADRLAQVA